MKNTFWKSHATLGVSVRKRNDYADYDYLDKLNHKELKWLKGFHREYINADFKHTHTKVIKRTKKNKREVYTLNNIRNRDLYNVAKWTNRLKPIDYETYKILFGETERETLLFGKI